MNFGNHAMERGNFSLRLNVADERKIGLPVNKGVCTGKKFPRAKIDNMSAH